MNTRPMKHFILTVATILTGLVIIYGVSILVKKTVTNDLLQVMEDISSFDDMLDAIMELAESNRSPVDWLDAATLSFQVTQNTAVDCIQAMSPSDEQVF